VLDVPLNSQATITIDVVADDGTMAKYSVIVRRTLALHAEIFLPGTRVALTPGGHGFALSGSMMTALQTGKDGSISLALYARAGTNWLLQDNVPKPPDRSYRSVALNERWLAAGAWGGANTMDGLVNVADRTQLPYRAVLHALQPAAPEDWFGGDVALYGDTLAVLSATRVHIYEYVDQAWKHVAQFDVGGHMLALGDGVLAVGVSNGIKAYRRSGATWSSVSLGGSTSDIDVSALAISSGALAAVERYVCIFSCSGTAPNLHLFDMVGTDWPRTTVAPLFGANVPRRLDPNGFGIGLALDETVALTSAIAEASLRGGVNSAAPPDVSGLPELSSVFEGIGVVYVRAKRGKEWKIEAVLGPRIRSNPLAQPAAFGAAIHADRGLIGVVAQSWPAQGQEDEAGGGGAIYIFGPDCSKVPPGAEVLGC
jgi:hypothetical protein